jgi:flagellar biosynthesis anti-sigma factor FlgM
MRIDPINASPIDSVASPSVAGEVKPSRIDPASSRLTDDTANLNQVADLVAKAMQQPEIRMDKVEAIKSKIASGNYKVDASAIADALISSAEI